MDTLVEPPGPAAVPTIGVRTGEHRSADSAARAEATLRGAVAARLGLPADALAIRTSTGEAELTIELVVSRLVAMHLIDLPVEPRPEGPGGTLGAIGDPLDLRVLGPVELHADGPVPIPGANQRRILAALAMHAGEVVSADRLVDVTWTDERRARPAIQNVRTYVCRIRAALDGVASHRLETRPPGYVLDLRPDELDAARFDSLVTEARDLMASADPDRAAQRLDAALALWHGQPYAEFADETWARAEVARLVERRIEALELRCESLLASGQPHAAVVALAAAIEEHPLRERPRWLQMVALSRLGRHVDALRAFQTFRTTLVEEVGIEPSRELLALDQAIAVGDASVLDTGGSRPALTALCGLGV